MQWRIIAIESCMPSGMYVCGGADGVNANASTSSTAATANAAVLARALSGKTAPRRGTTAIASGMTKPPIHATPKKTHQANGR